MIERPVTVLVEPSLFSKMPSPSRETSFKKRPPPKKKKLKEFGKVIGWLTIEKINMD